MSADPVVLLHSDRPEPAADIVRQAHPDLTVVTCDDYESVPRVVADHEAEVVYTVRFAGTPGFPRAAMVESPTVRWVSVGGSGTDHLAPWDPQAVTVTNAAGVAADIMAEYALGTVLHFSLDLDRFRAAQARRAWAPAPMTPVEGQTALIVGLGQTGQAAARRFGAMGMTVLGVRARPAPVEAVDEVHPVDALPDLLPRADVVLVCVPLLPSTRGLLGADAFAAIKPGAVLVNVARGGVVDEDAMLAALRDGRLKGAALDVFETEPLPADSPLWDAPNVIVTPHCSAVYKGWDLRSVAMFAENLGRYRQGVPLSNVVDPARGY